MPLTSRKFSLDEALASNPKASAPDVIVALGQQGIEVNAANVNNVKHRSKKLSTPSPPGRGTTVSRGDVPKSKARTKSTSPKRKAVRVERPFPRVTLKDAVDIPLVIRHKNGGNPWVPNEVAKALDRPPRTSSFFYLTAASRDFGLTTGTRDTAEIALTDLGRRLAYAETPEEELATRREAFFKVDLFS